ncbi:hypothetical protein BD779DRAFT_1667244 [Infundibulicybe gibba]|nr:hypothetical protein BD779DRAFT_1667244 [Infundibulicybe gibba]
MAAKNDSKLALDTVQKFPAPCYLPKLTLEIPTRPPQIADAEEDLEPRTIEDLVNPQEEEEIGDLLYRFNDETNDPNRGITAEVQHQMAVEAGEMDESDSEHENDGGDLGRVSFVHDSRLGGYAASGFPYLVATHPGSQRKTGLYTFFPTK